MIVDALLQLSAAQAVTVDAVSTNTIDLSVARDMAPGSDLFAVFGVDEAATAAGAATVTFQVITSAAANLGSPTVIGQSGAIPKTDLTLARKPFAVRVDPQILLAQANGQRYLGVNYVIGTGPLTAGKFTCYITNSLPPGLEYYSSGFTVA